MSSVSVPVIDDDLVEGNETFSITLSFSTSSSVNKGITLGARYNATVNINDSTGKYIIICITNWSLESTQPLYSEVMNRPCVQRFKAKAAHVRDMPSINFNLDLATCG